MEGTSNAHSQSQHAPSGAEDTAAAAPVRLDYMGVKAAAMTLRAINHKLRQAMIKLLEDNKKLNVTDLYVKLRLEQSVASQHLSILRRAQIVITEREGKYILYSLNQARIAEISRFIADLVSSADNHSKGHLRARREESTTEHQPSGHEG